MPYTEEGMEARDVGPRAEFSFWALDALSTLDRPTGDIGVKGLRNEGRCFRYELGIAADSLGLVKEGTGSGIESIGGAQARLHATRL